MKNNIKNQIDTFVNRYYDQKNKFQMNEFISLMELIMNKFTVLNNDEIIKANMHLKEIMTAYENKDYYYVVDYLENVFAKSNIIRILSGERDD